MIKMVDKQLILHRYRTQEQGKRTIAREMGLNRKTVERVVSEYHLALSSDDPEQALELLFSTRPKYNSSTRTRRVITDAVKELIEECLDENRRKRDIGLHKQCKAKQDIHELLINSGFTVSYPSVCKYICALNKINKKPLPAFIRAYYQPGEVCEFDWGEVKVKLDGKWTKLQMAIFTLAHSNARYAYLFRHQNTLAFMECHRNFFRDTKGVPHLMVYDNMRVAISKFVGREKHPTEALMRLSTFYKFAFRFCNIRSGNEKGHVERSVEVVRRRAFANKDKFAIIEQANDYLASVCIKINNRNVESVLIDIEALQPQVNTIGCFEMSGYKVDKWSTICMKAVHYSVPDYLVGKMVDVKIYSEKIVIFYEESKIATHQRIYTKGEWSVKLEHYLKTLLKKPGAVASSVALRQADGDIRYLFNTLLKDSPRDFILLLHYMIDNKYSSDKAINAFEQLKKQGIKRPTIDQIKVIMHSDDQEIEIPESYTSDEFIEIERSAINTLKDLSVIMNSIQPINNNSLVWINQ